VLIHRDGTLVDSSAYLKLGIDTQGSCKKNAANRGQWYNFSDASRRLYVYNAHYDDRPSLLSQPVVRLIVISDPVLNVQRMLGTLFCILQYKGTFIWMRITEHPRPIGFGWPLNGSPAREYVFTCPTIRGAAPDTVSISSNLTSVVWLCVPVTLPYKPITPRGFGVCVQAVYKTLDPYRLIEWLEVQKLFGVNFVGIYVLSASEPTLKILNYYSNTGFVELHKINYIYAAGKDVGKEYWLHLTPAINDCIYRHMYELKRILVIDFDEFIVPRMHRNLSGLVSFLDEMFASRNSPRVNYIFRNNYFFLDLPPDDDIPPHLTVLRFRKKVKISPDGYSVKSMINPRACIHMHNHYCWGVTANYSRDDSTESVDPAIALIHHYKKCHFPVKECRYMKRNSKYDDAMLFLKEPLTENVRKMVKITLNEEI